MNRFKTLAVASCLGLATLLPNALADTWNKKTILTVNEPIMVPGKVLQPGKYVMRLLDSPSNRHIVQIFNEREDELQTTVLAIPNYRLQPTGNTEFQWWEVPAGQPKAMRAWFYPGDNFGQEFAYPKAMAVQIAATTNDVVPTTTATNQSEMANAEVSTVNRSGEETRQETQVAQATPPPAPAQEAAPAPMPAPAPEAAPAPTEDQTRARTLPRTASPFPMVGLAGFLALGTSVALRAIAKRA